MFKTKLRDRPVIDIRWTPFDKTIEGITFCILILLWTFVVVNFHDFPDQIITHYNFDGKADDYGNKTAIWNLPVTATVLYLLLTIVNRYPQIFNYLEEITMDNAESQYRNGTRTIRILKLVIVIVFTFITYCSIPYNNELLSAGF